MRPWEAHGPLRAPHDQGLSMTFMGTFFQKKKKRIESRLGYIHFSHFFFFFFSFFSLKF